MLLPGEEAVAVVLVLRVIRDVVRTIVALYFLRQLQATQVDFSHLSLQESADDYWESAAGEANQGFKTSAVQLGQP